MTPEMSKRISVYRMGGLGMTTIKQKRIDKEAGFAFILALLATLIITSLGILIFTLTTRDIRVSIKSAGEKMAASAAESCIQELILQADTSLGMIANYQVSTNTAVDAGNPNNTGYYTISNNAQAWVQNVPVIRPIAGYEMGGTGATHDWSDKIYNKSCTGTDTRYGSQFDIDVAIGYGPIDMSTSQPAAGG
jgi:Tfp pilus assembly protein PilX